MRDEAIAEMSFSRHNRDSFHTSSARDPERAAYPLNCKFDLPARRVCSRCKGVRVSGCSLTQAGCLQHGNVHALQVYFLPYV